MRRLRADSVYASVEPLIRQEARLRAQTGEVPEQTTAPDSIATVLARFDARQHPRLKGPVKVRHPAPARVQKPGRVA
jgi:hypothetical protein